VSIVPFYREGVLVDIAVSFVHVVFPYASLSLFPPAHREDHGFNYSALLLAVLFLYMEISQRISSLPVNMVNISRPFAAHW